MKVSRFAVKLLAALAGIGLIAATLVAQPEAAQAAPSVQTQNFAYTGALQSFTVPSGITQLTLTATGAEGGRGGRDSQGEPIPGGYKGRVTGTIDVVPGQVMSISVGGGGTNGAGSTNSQSRAAAGYSPLSGYAGGQGGMPGGTGSSGGGGGGGAATVVSTTGATIVAGGAGGGGGSGQWQPLVGRQAEASHSARSDATSGVGQNGYDVMLICSGNCDGGGSGAGGGGARGGKQGTVEFGTGTYTEWLGYGGFPGSNSTAGLTGLSASYLYFAGNGAGGSVSISYSTGTSEVPTNVIGTSGDSSVALTWSPPASTGGSAITDYVIQYALSTAPTSWTTFADGTSTDRETIVTGLDNGLAYLFRVAAVNSFGTSSYSANSEVVSASGVPAAPVLQSTASADARLTLAFTPPTSGSPILRYEYQLDNGTWVAATGTSSPITIAGLVNGAQYGIALRAVSRIGTGLASEPITGTPMAAPGAPSIEEITPGVRSASVSFSPGFTGGGAFTGYQYRVDGGTWVDVSSTTSPLEVTGLSDATTHSIELRAVNAAGAGAPSTAIFVTTPAVPSAPTVLAATPTDRALTVAFEASASGGSVVTEYQYQLGSGEPWVTAPSTSSPIYVDSLSNGTTYDVRVRAVNAVGTGSASATVSATPATTPGAPAIVGDTVSGSDGTLVTEFTAPAHLGGATLTGYEYSTDGGATWRARDDRGTTESPLLISTLSSDGTTALDSSTTYYVEVRAVNAMGAGTASGVAPGILRTTPSAPTITSVVASSGALAVQFAPGANGGSPVTRYEYRVDAGQWQSTGSLGSDLLLASLTNGTEYSVEIRAINAEGDGVASAAASGTPRDLPGQASVTSVTPTHQTLTLAVNVADTGGSAVTGWEYSTDGGTTWAESTSIVSPIAIAAHSSNPSLPLTNGDSYAVSVRAINAAGTGPASTVRVVSPRAVPAEPVIVVTPLDGALSVAYTVADDGGSPVTRIEYTTGGSWIDAGSLSSPFVIAGLANGTEYPVNVRAVNVAGPSAVLAARPATPRTAPDAPTTVTATADDSSALVSWSPPASNGGSAVTSYVATAWASVGSTTPLKTATTASTSTSITGLSNLTTYYVSVVAVNAAGTSVASSPRVAVTPLAKPGAPTIGAIVAANTYLTVPFTAGTAGSMAITGYQYQVNGGTWVSAGTTSPVTISSLTNGTEYSVRLRAVSAAGAGAASAAVLKTPFTLPDSPNSATIVAEPGSGVANVSWDAPNANGSTITGYTVVAWSALTQGSQSRTCTTAGATSCQITGLSNGTTYYITIDATNGAGTSTRSTPRIPVVYTGAPGRSSALSGTSGDASVALTWTAGTTGLSATSDYTVWYKASTDSSYTRFTDSVSSATSATVTGLTNGTAYTFVVYGVNSNGTSIASAASTAVTPIGPGVAPTFGTPVRTVDGFTVDIANFDATTVYTATATSGAIATVSGSTVTVTGLAPSMPATASVTAARHGYTLASGDVSGSALTTGEAPTLGETTSIDYGFTVQITNLDVSADYAFVVPGGTATRSGTMVTVTGLAPSANDTVEVIAVREGRTNASGFATGTALPAAPTPVFGGVSQTVDGFSVTIDSYDPAFAYLVSVTNGATVVWSEPTITVTGLAPGATTDVTVTVSKAGFTTAVAGITAGALSTGVSPTLAAGYATLDGFTFSISSPDGSGYVVYATAGSVSLSGTYGVVSGLAPGETSTVTVVAVRSGYTDAQSTVLGTAIPAGTLPAAGSPTFLHDGFSFEIVNWLADTTYVVTTSAGVVVLSGSTVIVSGLAPGESATVTIVASRLDEADAITDVTGTATTLGVPPSLAGGSTIDGGFTFTIADYDPSFAYTFTGTNGAVFSQSGPSVTVTGVAPSTTSDVTVTKSRPGHDDSVGYVSGTSAAAPPPPPPAPAAPAASSAGQAAPEASAAGPAAPAAPSVPRTPTVTPLTPGQGGAKIGNTAIDFVISYDGKSASGTAGGMSIVIEPQTDKKSGSNATSHLTVGMGGSLTVQVSGFLPGTELDVWGFSRGQLLSQGNVEADSSSQSRFPIPASMKPGPHTLVIVGTSLDGQEVTASIGFTIRGIDRLEVTKSGASLVGWQIPVAAWWLLGSLLVMAVAAGLAFSRASRRAPSSPRT